MRIGIKVYTSYITEHNLAKAIENNLLPVFILRCIGKSELTYKWAGSSLHFKHLAPSQELFWNLRDGKIDYLTFSKLFLIELSKVNLQDTVERLDYLSGLCNANGVVLFGAGENPEESHRTLISDVLWRGGYLSEKPEEL